MGNQTGETLLLTVDIQANLERIAQLKVILANNKKELDNLNKAFKENRISQQELAVGQTVLEQKTKNAQQEIGTLNRLIDAQDAAFAAAGGSVDQLTAKAKLLTAQYNALGTEQKKSTAGKSIQDELKKTNEALQQAGANVSDFSRNVGNYKQALVEAAKESGLFGGVLDRTKGAQEKYAAAQKLTTAIVGESTGAIKLLKVAFIALPIFAIAAALGALYATLTKTQAGMDFVEKKTAAVGAVFNVLLKIIEPIGAAMLRLFTDPKQAASDFVDFLKNNVANRVAAFGVLIDAIRNRDFKKLTDGAIQLSTGITNGTAKVKALGLELASATKAAEGFTAETQRIRAAERELNVERDQSRAKIEGLKKLSDDSTKSVATRTAAAKEAAAIENRLLSAQLKLQADKVANLVAEQKLKGNITNEDKDALAELKREQANTAQESLTLQTELQNKINQLATEGLAATQKLRAQAVQKQINQQQELLQQTEKNSVAELSIQKRIIELTAQQAIVGATTTAEQRKAIELKAQTDIQKLTDDFATNQLERERKRMEDRAKEAQREYGEAQKNLQDFLDKKTAEVEKQYSQGLLGEGEYQRQLIAIEKAGLDAALVNAKDYSEEYGAIQKKQADNEIKENKRVKDEKKKIEDTKQAIVDNSIQAAITASDTLVSLLGEETEAGQAALAIKKTLALAEIAINLQKQLSLNKITAAELKTIPVIGIALGIAYEIAADAAAIAGAAAAASKILGFNKGGIYKPGAGGPNADDTSTVVHLTPGEAIMTRDAVEAYGPLLGQLNASVGGVNFAAGQELPPVLGALTAMYQGAPSLNGIPTVRFPQQIDGGLAARNAGNQQLIDYKQLAAAMHEVELSVGVKAFRNAEAQYDRPRDRTSLGGKKK